MKASNMYDDMCDKWMKRPSNSQPYIHLTLTIENEDYKALGLDLRKRTRTVTLPAMADTGSQSCLNGVKVAQQMGLSTDDLIPVSMTMKAANNEGIRILWAAVARFAGNSRDARRLETRQIAYVTDTSDCIFLSRTACVDLGMISDRFLASSDPCDRPRRAEPPTRPTTLPMPATEANRGALRKHLLGLYAQSTPGRSSWHAGRSTRWHASDAVSPHGNLRKEERQATTNRRFPSTEQACAP